MREYHKIDTLFEREETGNHKLIVGKFRSKAVEMCKDLKWQFTEKVDGTNIRIFWNGHKVEFNGRTDNAQLHKDLFQLINDKFCTNEIEELFEQKFGEKEVFLFCEGYGAGIQTGGGYRKDKGLILFDVQVGGRFLDREAVVGLGGVFGLDVVPLVLEGTIQDGVDFVLATEKTQIGDKEAVFEGVVGRLPIEMQDVYGNRMIVKIKRCDFVS